MLKCVLMRKMTKEISLKTFIVSQSLILILGLLFLFGLYYFLNTDSKGFSYQQKGPVTTPPKSLKIDLETPLDDTLTFDSTILVSGKTAPSSEVLIFIQTYDAVVRSRSDGYFSTVVKLDEGTNHITAVVFDASGDSRSAERNVYYSKEKI